MRVLCLVLLAACAVLVADARPLRAGDELGTVEGAVKYKGEPLPDGTITFHLADDQFVGAKVKDGKNRVDRVLAGKAKVSFASKKLLIPEKYAREETTTLEVDIKNGKATVDFALND
jgi:hypothetical protein